MIETEDFRATAWDSPLSPNEKILLFALRHASKGGDSNPNQSSLAAMCSLSDRTVRDTLSSLVKKNVLYRRHAITSAEQIKRKIVKSKSVAQELCIEGSKICSWCRGTTLVLHAHHFPVRREDGGTETVDICPNCHFEYHALETGAGYDINPIFSQPEKGVK